MKINAYKILIGKSEGNKRPFGRYMRRWKDNIKMEEV
jgi:hypothetical protein